MKRNNEVWLSLEVLEDRMALSGAFGGAIDAGIPQFPPVNTVNVAPAIIATQQVGFRGGPTDFNNQVINQFAAFQNQLQSIQAAQMAMIDQLFNDIQSLIQQMNIHTVFVF